jgi:hypothetical protein
VIADKGAPGFFFVVFMGGFGQAIASVSVESQCIRGGVGAMHSMAESYIEVWAEQRIWTAVIARAVEEWASGTVRSQREAESYLFGDQEDFPMVCRSAGLDPETLRRKLRKLKASGAGPSERPIHQPLSATYTAI